MHVTEAIAARRSIRRFTDRPITRDDIEPLLEIATLAPNHRLTQPWRFYVLGPEARAAYGSALGERKARRVEDAAAKDEVRKKTTDDHRALPCMIAVSTVLSDNPEIREEDYAATMMAISNITLAAVARGLGTHLKTGAIMDDPAARAAVGVSDNERIIAVINLGEPAEIPPPRNRTRAADVTQWRG